MPPPAWERAVRRLFAVPSWTERAVLVAVGLWLIALAGSKLVTLVDTAGAMLLPPVQTSPSSWVPQRPLGDAPFRIESTVMMLTILEPALFVVLGLALWPTRAGRRRVLALFACFSALLAALVWNAMPSGRTNGEAFLAYQLTVWPFVAMGFVLVWPHLAARRLALVAAGLLGVAFAAVFWISGEWSWAPLPRSEAGMAALYLGSLLVRACIPLVSGIAMLLAARAARDAPRSQPSPSATP